MYLYKKIYYVVDVLFWYRGIIENVNMMKWFCIFGKDKKYFVNC